MELHAFLIFRSVMFIQCQMPIRTCHTSCFPSVSIRHTKIHSLFTQLKKKPCLWTMICHTEHESDYPLVHMTVGSEKNAAKTETLHQPSIPLSSVSCRYHGHPALEYATVYDRVTRDTYM